MNINSQPRYAARNLPLPLALICFGVLGCSYIVNAMDRQVFSLLLPTVMQTYGFPLNTGGLLVTIFTLGIGLAGIPAAYLMERLSRRAVMITSIAVFSVFTIMTAYAHGFTDMLIYRALTGVGEGMQIAALYAATGAYFRKHRALMFGILSALFGAGNFIGPLVAGSLLQSYDNWQVPLIVFGLAGIAFTILVSFVPKDFTEHREQAREVSSSSAIVPERVWSINLVLAAIAAGTFGVYQYGYIALYPTYLAKQLQHAPGTVGFTMSMFGAGAILAVPAAYLGDRLSQKWIIFIALVCCAFAGYMLFNVASTPTQHAILSFLVGFAGTAVIANISSLMQRRVPPSYIAKASGIFVTTVYLPASISGYVLGSLVGAYGWGNAAAIQLSFVPLIGAVAILVSKERDDARPTDHVVSAAAKA
ncbi:MULTISPECIES: MFS transporter [Rhizobium/Agrobacterium group]|uniref:MFS transporter n=1 Tax=Rhizobium/Agrobacterium group TaxID=227290 RepID=UPI001ADC870F|nr:MULTISPECIES: MFS transporter [Rhizobium/Agrobacterium group]MBO9112584.1 MFS transporter [Agrobacterium sp. S2/73]QXZ76086.1 MFS transporter [Agrobacterium sp. S7/73]QYA16908.1 MFS transporter [Rhizobium sp. AB2/73]UEQ85520.1 MFS transporter [Rhizobium sp. AB2/73]